MSHFTHLKRTVFLGLLASAFVGSPAFGAISLPSALELEKAIYFQNPAGEPVQIKAGIYEVEQNGETALNIIPAGSDAGEATPIQAIPAGHEEDIEANTAHLVPSPDNNADKQHLVFVTPEGLALEAVGSYSGVFSRSAMTWGEDASADDEAGAENPLMVSFEKATFFKTVGGDPKSIQPGDYEVALADDGLTLTPSGDTKGEAITIESEALGTSTAAVVPEFGDNPDLELLMIATAGGQSIAAVGSHTGTFPRGFGFLKKAVGKVKSAAKGVANKAKKHVVKHVKKGVRIAHGHVKKHVKRVIHTAKKHGRKVVGKVRAHGKKFIQKHGKKMASRIVNHGKKIVSKLCGKGKAGKCLNVIAQHGGKLLQGAGS